MAHKTLQRDEVTAAFAKEAVRETVSQLMRGEGAYACPLADTPDHSHQRLRARRLLRIPLTADTLVLRNPLLDFDGENVIVKLRLELVE